MNLKLAIAASAEERDACYRFRYEMNRGAFKQLPSVCHRTGRLVDALDELATIQYVEDRGRVVGTMRSILGCDALPPQYYRQFRIEQLHDLPHEELGFDSRLAVDPAYRKTMTLLMMLGGSYHAGRKRGATIGLMLCAPALVPMYEKLGYQCYTRGLAQTELGNQVPMMLIADDAERLKQLGSPFGQWAVSYTGSAVRREWFRSRFPEFVDGMSPALCGVSTFLARLRNALAILQVDTSGILTLLDLLSSTHPKSLKRPTWIRCQAGDTAADSGHAFGDLIIQLQGTSRLSSNSAADEGRAHVQVISDCALIDDFLIRKNRPVLRLICDSDSDFLMIPARDLPPPETLQPLLHPLRARRSAHLLSPRPEASPS